MNLMIRFCAFGSIGNFNDILNDKTGGHFLLQEVLKCNVYGRTFKSHQRVKLRRLYDDVYCITFKIV